uniref:Uncharacterized protein n=1 Tax=Avena sativa TaxID=4498 RepID=A0ACD5WA56_AVESA
MNNIEMIASSLRNCSLNGGLRRRDRARHAHAEGSDDSEGVTVELNSEVALPYHWQQCLDIRTGQVYYVNWEDGTRTTVDPRTPLHLSTLSTPRSISFAPRRAASTSSSGSSYSSASSVGTVAAAEWFSSAAGGYGYEESNGYNDMDDEESSSTSSCRSSAISSFSPTDESASASSGSDNGNTPGHVLVAAGCRGCFMYFMVPKSAGLCPKCGSSGLVHLGRSNSASYV